MMFVLLPEPDHALHIYDANPPTRTLCGRPVREAERGWFATGCPVEDPTFPFGPLCPACRDSPERKTIEARNAEARAKDPRSLAEKLLDLKKRMGL